jgi:hypothetical protein
VGVNNMKKRFIILCIILLLFNAILIPSIDSTTINLDNNIKIFGDKPETSGIRLDASSPYDYGLRIGRLLRSQYKLIDFLARFTKKSDTDSENIKEQIHYMEEYCPFFLEELKGLSVSTNIRLERLLTIHKLISSIFDGMCTTTLSTGVATKHNETFLTHNVDHGTSSLSDLFSLFVSRFFSWKLWVVKINTMKYRYAFWGIPILREWPCINEKGLGFGGDGLLLTKNESRYIDEGPGISTYMLERLTLMTCKNVSEVAMLWKNTERASGTYKKWPHHWDNSISGWCDREGGILMIEQTHNHIITVFGNSTEITDAPEGILWHTNHHLWLDPNLTGSMFRGEHPSSTFRATRARELLNNNYGNITLNECKNITRDHSGGSDKNGRDSYDICKHPDKNWSSVNAFAWIVQPKKLTVYWTHRSPCRSRFIKRDLTKIFEK